MKKELINVQLASIDECPYPDRKQGLLFIHDFDYNGNGLKIPEELSSQYLDSLNGSPLVAYYDEFSDDLGDHAAIKDRKTKKIIGFKTHALGVLFNAHIGTHEVNGKEKYGVYADSYLWTRFENTVNCIEKLYQENGRVDLSVEVQIGAFEFSDDGRTAQEYLNYFGTALLGSNVKGAYSDAALYTFNELEVAQLVEAYNLDISLSQQEKDNINNNQNGGGNVFKFLLETNADLSFAEMRKIMNSHLSKIGKTLSLKKQMMDLNAMDAETYGQIADAMLVMMPEDSRYFDFWIPEDGMFEGYCVCSDWYNNTLIKMDWAKNDMEIMMSNPRKARIVYEDDDGSNIVVNSITKELSDLFKKSQEINETLEQKEKDLSELKSQKDSELSTIISEKEIEIINLKSQIENLTKEISTKDDALKLNEQSANETIVKLGQSIDGLKDEISSMQPMIEDYKKTQEELAEKAKQDNINELKVYALSSHRIEEKELTENQEIAEAIANINKAKIDAIIAQRVIAAEVKVIPGTKENEDIVLSVKEPEDLIVGDISDEMYAPRKKD